MSGKAIRLKARATEVAFYVEDCVGGMRARLGPGSVDVVVTSPPYNLGTRYGTYKDDIPRAEYLAWTGEWVGAVKEVLAEDGSLFLNVGGKPSDPWGPLEVARVAGEHLVLQNTIHWVKSIAIMKEDVGSYPGLTKDVVVGHYKPINSKRYLNDAHEYIFHFTRSGAVELDRLAVGVPYQDTSNIKRWKGASDVHCRGNTWFIPYKTIMRRKRERPHPATFPAKLPEMCIRLHGARRVRRVLDPFLGLGSTAVAAVEAGVPEMVGFELDAEYVDWAVQRLSGEPPERAHQERLGFD
jgi:site-specific DNA-methyltransferase (adenine-specific)